MVEMKDRSSLERLLRPLRRELNAEFAAALLRMQADDELQTRYEYLAERNTEGLFDSKEQMEMDSSPRLALFCSIPPSTDSSTYGRAGALAERALPHEPALGNQRAQFDDE